MGLEVGRGDELEESLHIGNDVEACGGENKAVVGRDEEIVL